MCGGNQNRASDEAQRAEEGRQSQVRESTRLIDQAFSGRDSQLNDFANALRGEFRTEANKQKGVADRQLKFSLARGGLTGGSAAADAGAQLGDEFQKGLLQGERGVQNSLSDLAAADESSRQNLIALAQGGAGVASSARNAASAMRANIAGARSNNVAAGLGDIFGNTSALYKSQQEAAARRKGLKESEIYADPFSGES